MEAEEGEGGHGARASAAEGALLQTAKRGEVKGRALSGLPLFATLAGLAAAGDAIAKRTRVGKALTGPVATMLCGAVLVTLPLGEPAAVDLTELKAAQSFLVTVSTPLLLMGTNLRSIVKGAGPLVPGFLVGSMGSLLGCLLGCAILGDRLSETLRRAATSSHVR